MTRQSDRRIRVVVGHYGSGKTEFAVNYAFQLAEQGCKTALIDLDIANPYFRSRERQCQLEEKGIRVYSNTFGYDITADLPAVTAAIRTPLEDPECQTVVDVGGNDLGARVLIQFEKFWKSSECDLFCVVNANRPETGTAAGAMDHITRIEKETGLKITGLINNTHLLRETKTEDIIKGYRLCCEISEKLNIPVKYSCCTEGLMKELLSMKETENLILFRMNLYMRDSWLDR